MAVRILRLTDVLEIEGRDLKFYISPLSKEKKQLFTSTVTIDKGDADFDGKAASRLYLKHGLKKIKGLKDYHGEYQ